jgi:DNA-binding NarL/FixJ family response regulator
MARGMVERDHSAATTAVEFFRAQGSLPTLMVACVVAGLSAHDPRPWLHEAHQLARQLGDGWMRHTVKAFMVRLGVTPPRTRADRTELSVPERMVITLVRKGLTNRQIAAAVNVSEKTVENHLTRLFAKTGCRSRLDLAAASLDGRIAVA